MTERKKFIDDYLTGEFTVTELCGRYGISRKTGHKWIRRFMDHCELGDRSATASSGRSAASGGHRPSRRRLPRPVPAFDLVVEARNSTRADPARQAAAEWQTRADASHSCTGNRLAAVGESQGAAARVRPLPQGVQRRPTTRGGDVPADHYERSARPLPEPRWGRPFRYSDDYDLASVSRLGYLQWNGRSTFLSSALAEETLGLDWKGRRRWHVYFGTMRLGALQRGGAR